MLCALCLLLKDLEILFHFVFLKLLYHGLEESMTVDELSAATS